MIYLTCSRINILSLLGNAEASLENLNNMSLIYLVSKKQKTKKTILKTWLECLHTFAGLRIFVTLKGGFPHTTVSFHSEALLILTEVPEAKEGN